MAYTFDQADFLKIYPQFSTVASGFLEFHLSFAQKIVGSYLPAWSDDGTFKMATYYVLAYLLSMFSIQNPDGTTVAGAYAGDSGIVSSASEGSVSVSMSIPALANTWWGKNQFGTTALMFLRSFAKGGVLVDGTLPMDIVDV